jgi:hypothetical protein
MRLTATFLGLAVLGAAATASPADWRDRDRDRDRYARENYRHGFLIGFSLGAGALEPDGCDDCGVAGGGELHMGAMASRSVAVVFEGAATARGDVAHGMAGVGAQWWPDPSGRFWLRAGIGVGALDHTDNCDAFDFDCVDDFDFDDDDGYLFPTVFGAAGFEVIRSGSFTMDVLARGMVTDERHRTARSMSVNVGFNWY